MREQKKDHFPTCIPEIEKIIGYTFRDKSLITQAFTRTSFCNERDSGYQSNEVLEFIGDSVLSVAIITFLTEMHAERYEHGIKTIFGEGDFSNIKSKLSDKKNLSECIGAIGLEKYLRLGEGDKKLGIEKEPSVKEDLFESIIGATYIDCERDIRTVMGVVSKMLDVSIYAVKTPPTQSSKNALQEFCADKKRKLPQPIYKTLSEDGPDHKKVYERGVYVGERLVASAKGKNLKLADAGAAELALKILLSEEETMKKATETESEAKPKSTTSKGSTSTQKEKKANGGTKNETKASAANTPSNEKSNATSEKKVVKKRPEKRLKEKETVSKTPKESPTKAPTSANRSKDNKKQTVVNKNTTPKSENNPTESQAKTALNLTRPTTKVQNAPTSSAAKLKNHATKSKVATPTFKDLGESREGGKTVYRVECIFMGKSTIGVGASRPEAKEDAAGRILSSITSQGEKKQKNESGTKAKRPKRK